MLASAEAQRDVAQAAFERARKLFGEHLVSQAEYDQAEAQAKQATAAVHEVEATIDRKTIRAPFAGVTGIRRINLGQYVRSGDAIVPLESLDAVHVDFSVPQQQAASVRVGATVQVTMDGEGSAATGRVTAIDPMVEETTRNVRIQATLPNPRGTLRSGAFVHVQVVTGTRAPEIALPVSAINYAPYGNSVFIVGTMKGPDGKSYLGVRQQFVKLGPTLGDQVSVLSGVKAGDEVVTSGVFKLRPGGAVQINNAVQPSNSTSPKPENS